MSEIPTSDNENITIGDSSEHLIKEFYLDILTPPYYGLKQVKIFMLAFLAICIEGIHLSIFSLMLIPIKRLYSLTDNMIIIASLFIFIGFAFGSFFSGILVKRINRKIVSISSLLIILLLNTALGLFIDITVFIVLRTIIGFCLGIVVPISNNLLCEHLPIKNRSFILTFVWIAFPIGQIFLLILMKFLMPDFETEMVNVIILITAAVPFITLIYYIFAFEDSPRNIVLTYKEERCITHLNRLGLLEHEDTSKIIRFIKQETKTDTTAKTDYLEIFRGNFALPTIIFSILWFGNSLTSYGLQLIYTLTLRDLGIGSEDDEGKLNGSAIISKQIIICLIYMPSYLISGAFSEIEFIGRKKSVSIGYIVAGLCLILAILFTQQFYIFFGIFLGLQVIPINIGGNFAMEIYPTKMRDLAIGFLYMTTRAGGCASQVIYILLNKMDTFVPYYFAILTLVLSGIITLFLPYETVGKHLDFHV
jgi:MFS family permease